MPLATIRTRIRTISTTALITGLGGSDRQLQGRSVARLPGVNGSELARWGWGSPGKDARLREVASPTGVSVDQLRSPPSSFAWPVGMIGMESLTRRSSQPGLCISRSWPRSRGPGSRFNGARPHPSAGMPSMSRRRWPAGR
jgi:hypothetical protein